MEESLCRRGEEEDFACGRPPVEKKKRFFQARKKKRQLFHEKVFVCNNTKKKRLILLLRLSTASAMTSNSFATKSSRLVFGTLRLHETERPHELLDEAWRLGIRSFDTARVYGNGECEKILGDWLKSSQRRRSATVVTKGGCGDGSTLWRPDLSLSSLQKELETSVKTLGGTVDVYVLHRDEVERPVGEICRTMQYFVDSGFAKAWGVSNWQTDRIEEALNYARSHGLTPPSCSSLQDSLATPATEPWPGTVYMDDRQRQWYAKHRDSIAVLGWETLGKGFLAGRWDRHDNTFKENSSSDDVVNSLAWRESRLKAAYLSEDNFRRRERAAAFARTKGDFGSEHVAIAWCLAQDYDSHVITATVNPDHLRSNVRALSLQLTAQDVKWLANGGPTANNLNNKHSTRTQPQRVR